MDSPIALGICMRFVPGVNYRTGAGGSTRNRLPNVLSPLANTKRGALRCLKNLASARTFHDWVAGFATQKSTGQISINDLVPFCFGKIFRPLTDIRTRVVHQNINPTECRHNGHNDDNFDEGETVEEIMALDADNAAGLKNQYAIKIQLESLKSSLRIAGPDATLKRVETLLTEMKPQGLDLQEALFLKAQLIYGNDREGCKQTLLAAHQAAPQSDTAKNIRRILLQVFKTTVDAPPKSAADESQL